MCDGDPRSSDHYLHPPDQSILSLSNRADTVFLIQPAKGLTAFVFRQFKVGSDQQRAA
jgi:hypothetical protein